MSASFSCTNVALTCVPFIELALYSLMYTSLSDPLQDGCLPIFQMRNPKVRGEMTCPKSPAVDGGGQNSTAAWAFKPSGSFQLRMIN